MPVSIFLDDNEAKMFEEFMRYHNDFKFLLEGKLFDFCNGRAIIHRDLNGIIQEIHIEELTNKRKKCLKLEGGMEKEKTIK